MADFGAVRVSRTAPDRVHVTGARGTPRTGLIKVSVGYLDGFAGEGQISYAGPGAAARGRLALEIVRERLALTGVAMTESRFELIGADALHGARHGRCHDPYEVRVRVAGRTATLDDAVRIGEEVETLYTNGPAGGGGAFRTAREVLAIASALVPEAIVRTQGWYFEV